jgi:DNA-binding MarR family transcriptional regulator
MRAHEQTSRPPAAPATNGRDATRVLDGLRRTLRMLRVASRQTEQQLGVSDAQLFVLQQLEREPARSLNELAARTQTDQSSVSVVVSRLVERRLVSREIAMGDGRRVTIRLTSAGRALLRRAPASAQARLEEALGRLPRADLAALARGMGALAHALGARDGLDGARRHGAPRERA